MNIGLALIILGIALFILLSQPLGILFILIGLVLMVFPYVDRR